MDTVRFQKLIEIPACSGGYSLVTKSVANDGSLLFLSIESSGAAAVREMHESGIGVFAKTRMNEARRFRLSLARPDGSLQTIQLPPLDITFPLVDVFPNGRILLVAPRCEWRGPGDYDLNAVIFDPTTAGMSRILLGDGINRAYVDALGRIWVAYFDEGVFGNFGWGSPGAGQIGSAGLICFSVFGEKIWEYPPVSNMVDCYALNVSNAQAAIYFYTDFPLCRISEDFKLACCETELHGCHHFAIAETSVLFSGQYDDPPDAGYLGRFSAGEALKTRRVQLQLPDGSPLPKGQLLGRGEHLYFFDEYAAYRASVD